MTAGLKNLKHIVVLMMENRSFDHMLGALKKTDPRVNGLNGNETNPDPNGTAGGKISRDCSLLRAAPNELWCTDYKGEFLLGNHKYCYPLTVTDHASRFLLTCEALSRVLEPLENPFGPKVLPMS